MQDDDHYKPIAKPESWIKRRESAFVVTGIFFSALAAGAAAFSAVYSSQQIALSVKQMELAAEQTKLSAKQMELSKDLIGLEAQNNIFNELLKNYQEFCDIRATEQEAIASLFSWREQVKDNGKFAFNGVLLNYDPMASLEKEINMERYLISWNFSLRKLYNTFELLKIYTDTEKFKKMTDYLPDENDKMYVLDLSDENKTPFLARVEIFSTACVFRRTIMTMIYMDRDHEDAPEHWEIIPIPQSSKEKTIDILTKWGDEEAVRVLSQKENADKFNDRLHSDEARKALKKYKVN